MTEEHEQLNEPPEFKPEIPLWMKPHYDALPPHERWKCDLAIVQDMKNDWLIARAREAADHRSWINKRVDELAENVQPVVSAFALAKSVKGLCVAVLLILVVPAGLAILGAWASSWFAK